MGNVTGVQFQKNGKLYYFDSNGFTARVGDYVIVDTVRGLDLGEVIMAPREVEDENWNAQMKKIVRIATEQDIQQGRDNRAKEKEAFTICQKKIAEHKLEMKLVSVEYAFDNSKIMFFFTANGRVDFRSLVKDLASVFKMRIELRQIGVRDEAKMLGGLGPCGRQICCGSFLEQFQPVSIKMAKEQNLSLNPTKISGVCGRLMCCLKYEQDHYEQARKRMPKVGKEVSTPDGTGPVTDLNIVKETVFVRLVNGDTSEIKEYPLESITKLTDPHDAQGEPERKQKAEKEPGEPAGKKQPGKDEEKPAKNPASEPAQSDDSAAAGRNDGDAANRQKPRNKPRRAVLGQPVKRENPNRVQPQAADNAGERKETPKAPKAAENSSAGQKAADPPKETAPSAKPSPWANAVREAMLAIDKDK